LQQIQESLVVNKPQFPTAILVGESTTRLRTLPIQLLEPVYAPIRALMNIPAMTRSIANNITISNILSFMVIPFHTRDHPFRFRLTLTQFPFRLLLESVKSAVSWGLFFLCLTADVAEFPYVSPCSLRQKGLESEQSSHEG